MRDSGRTSIMLHRAVANALEGKQVLVVAATGPQAWDMYVRVRDMQTPQNADSQKLTLEYKTGRIVFARKDRHHEPERGWSGDIMVDHFVSESMASAPVSSNDEHNQKKMRLLNAENSELRKDCIELSRDRREL